MARGSQSTGDDARLWAVALCVSVLFNGALIAWISIEAIKSEIARKKAIPKKPPAEQVVKIFPEMLIPEPQEKSAEVPPEFARTTPDQEAADPPASRRYIGERNTEATSDRAPTADDINMPSQAGREARAEEMPETTESEYQDGKLDVADSPAPPFPHRPLHKSLRKFPNPRRGRSKAIPPLPKQQRKRRKRPSGKNSSAAPTR